MGYYSEVAVQMKREDYNRMLEELKATQFKASCWNVTPAEWTEYALRFVEAGYTSPSVKDYNQDDSECIRLHWDFVKWYGSPYITFLENFFHNNEVDFIRLGEGSDDVQEHWGLGDYEISLIRYLEFQ